MSFFRSRWSKVVFSLFYFPVGLPFCFQTGRTSRGCLLFRRYWTCDVLENTSCNIMIQKYSTNMYLMISLFLPDFWDACGGVRIFKLIRKFFPCCYRLGETYAGSFIYLLIKILRFVYSAHQPLLYRFWAHCWISQGSSMLQIQLVVLEVDLGFKSFLNPEVCFYFTHFYSWSVACII